MRLLRYKPKYNQLKLIYNSIDDVEQLFYAKDVTSSRYVTNLIGQPIKDGGSRFITDSDIDFEIDGEIIMDGQIKRITGLPEVRIKSDNLARKGVYRSDKVIVTT